MNSEQLQVVLLHIFIIFYPVASHLPTVNSDVPLCCGVESASASGLGGGLSATDMSRGFRVDSGIMFSTD
jgi:hypothetical protein